MDLFGEDETLWSTHRLNPKVKVTLDFRNASVDAVLQVLSRASGIPIVKDPSLTQPITLQSPKQQTLRDAFSMLSVALGLRGYELKRDGAMMVVKQKQQRGSGGSGRGGSSGTGGFDMSAMASMFGSSQQSNTVLRVYSIKFASASQVARVINDVFALTANQGFGMFGMPGMMGLPGMPGGMPGMPGGTPGGAPATPGGAPGAAPTTTPTPGQRTDSGRIVPAVNQAQGGDAGSNLELVAQRGGGGGMFGGGGGMFGGGGGMFGGGMNPFGRRGGSSSQSSTVRASSDDYSNSVIVNASATDHEQILKLIGEIDKEADKAQISKVYPLEYATASDLTSIIMNVLNANASRGRGYTGQQNTGGGGGMFGGMFGGNRGSSSATGGVGTVAAETRTNSLIVTTVPDNQEVVQQVIKELDKPIKFETGAFVISLKNARADTVASLLNSSFGGGRAGSTTNRTGTGSTRTNTGTTRTTNNRNTGGLPGLNAPAQVTEVEPTEVLTDDEIVDAVRRGVDPKAVALARAQGMGGFGGMISQIMGGGGGNRSSQSSTQNAVSYDSSGRVVTYQNLSGTVSAIADTNTNSVIIVTSPQNREVLQKILDQLDRIPEQVMIETLIVEASLDATNKLGMEWNFKGGSSAITTAFGLAADAAQPQGMRYTLTAKEYSGFLGAIKTDNRFEVLSTPRIFTSNNSEAEINISQSLPYVTNQRVDSNGNYSYSYSFMDVGIVLTVTPRITSNGYVTMDVTQTANDFVRYTDFNAPVVNQREAQTTVSVRDGETVVLGGIIKGSLSSTVNKIPILGDLPLLGAAFRSTNQTKSKTELLVFLSPKVVRDEADARALREQVEGQLQPKTLEKVLNSRLGQPQAAAKDEPAKLVPLKDGPAKDAPAEAPKDGAKVPGKS
jgi:general secretion pathway protein D